MVLLDRLLSVYISLHRRSGRYTSLLRFGIGSICIMSKMAPLNVDGAVCSYILKRAQCYTAGLRDVKVAVSRKEVRLFGATSGESLAEFFRSQIAIALPSAVSYAH